MPETTIMNVKCPAVLGRIPAATTGTTGIDAMGHALSSPVEAVLGEPLSRNEGEA